MILHCCDWIVCHCLQATEWLKQVTRFQLIRLAVHLYASMFTGTETGGISAGESWQDHVQYQAGSCMAGLAGCSRPASLPAGQARLCTQSLHQQASCSCLASLAGTPNTFLQPGTWHTVACAHEQSLSNSQGFSGYCKDPMNCCMAHICMHCRPDNIKDSVRQACVSSRDSSTHQPIKPYRTQPLLICLPYFLLHKPCRPSWTRL